ncbi:MAG TPA: mechanosensitive ion channel family protein, partial [Vicinamibacteria bacterium]|nr:mechanosensitive ion channel family protein [Vicinamibacteria bacterium]
CPRATRLLLSATLLLPAVAAAQAFGPGAKSASTPSPTPAPTPEPVAEASDSPRASARAFLDLARKADYEAAARYLQVPPGEEGRRPELARRLRAVLERHLDIDLDALSPLSPGSGGDGLPPGVDSVGKVPDGRGSEDPVFLVRARDAAGPFWAFSRQTVSRVDGWYEALPDRWVRDWMPAQLQSYGPGGLMWWQWLALPALLALALALGRVLGAFTTAFLHRLLLKTPTEWDERLLRRMSPALTLLWAVAVAAVLLPWLAVLPEADRVGRSLLGGLATLAVFWAIWRSVDVWAQFAMERPWARDNASARSLLSVTTNFARVFVAVGGLVATLAALGYPVATVLAGLGIGGLALAFGAQKTIENLFGSISLAADQPFRVGDFVKVGQFTGNVERIGMRSTRIRTLDRTVVTIPNGQLADIQIEDFASRDRIRFTATLSLVYGTSEAQVRRVLTQIEAMLRANPKVWSNPVAKLLGFSPSSVDIELQFWFATSDYDEFRELRQEALLGIMGIVAEAGTSLSPTQTVHIARRPPREGPSPAPAQRTE